MSSAPQYKASPIDPRRYPLVWRVVSGANEQYLVNLSFDSCTCNHWVYRLSKKEGEERRCKHINLARQRLTDIIIAHEKKLLTA